MSRKFTQSMALILSFCAAQNSWSNICFGIPSSAKLDEIKTELKGCREDYRALEQKVNELKDSTKKNYAELEKKFTESNEQNTKMYNNMMNMLNSSDQICNPQQVKLDEGVALTSSEPDFAEKIIEIIDARNAKVKEAENAGVKVVACGCKVVCADSKLEYDVYKTLNEKQKKVVEMAVKRGDKIEYVNSELLLNGETFEGYMSIFDENGNIIPGRCPWGQKLPNGASFVTEEEYDKLIAQRPNLKDAQIVKQKNGKYRVLTNSGTLLNIDQYLSILNRKNREAQISAFIRL